MVPEIRLLQPADASALFALRRRALLDSPEAFLAAPEDDFVTSESGMRERLEQGSTVYGAALRERVVGMLGFHAEQRHKTAHKALLWGMFVEAPWRGTGLGEGLLRAVVAHARTLVGVDALRLSVSESAIAARRLYEKVGFVVWGTEPDALRIRGRSLREHHMAFALNTAGS